MAGDLGSSLRGNWPRPTEPCFARHPGQPKRYPMPAFSWRAVAAVKAGPKVTPFRPALTAVGAGTGGVAAWDEQEHCSGSTHALPHCLA
jgi:hypothetical protein